MTGTPRGKLAAPKTERTDILSSPNTSRRSSDAASATMGWLKKSPDVARYTPTRTTFVTRSRAEMLLRDGESIQGRGSQCVAAGFNVELFAEAPDILRLPVLDW